MIKKIIIPIIAIAFTTSIFTGCATISLQTSAKMTRTIVIDDSQKENKTIFVKVKNTAGSGGENMQLASAIKEKLIKKGFTIANSSKDAGYGLFINVLFANSLKEANALVAFQQGMTTGMGAAITTGANSVQDVAVMGAVVAIGAGAAALGFEDSTFRAVIDVSVRDYQASQIIGTVKTETITDAKIQEVARSGNLNQFSGGFGHTNRSADISSGITESNAQSFKTKYIEHKTRVFAEAVQVNLEVTEAMPILEDKSASRIANIF